MIRGSSSCSGLCRSHFCEGKVSFVNVRTSYEVGEDLTLDYTLHDEFKSSTRDWIGIFPRNWSNLQQYLTFEYTVSPPPNAVNPLNRTITFPRIFHREAPLNLEYQFVYISKEIQIVATSSYFRFAPSSNFNATNGHPCAGNICTNSAVSSNTTVDKTEETQGVRQTCRYCHRKICGLKIDALRGDFLATFSDSLLNRVHRLEGNLSFAESALRNAKGARENLARRLQAYEAFVAEMLRSLSVRGVVKITDEAGTQFVLRRVNDNERMAEGDANNMLENEIVALKRLLDEQQQTIADLEKQQRKFNVSQRDRVNCVDREIQTNFGPDENVELARYKEIRNVEKSCDESRKNNSSKIMVNTKRGKLCLDTNVKDGESKRKREKLPLDVYGKVTEIDNIDGSKLFARNVERGNFVKDGNEPMVLRIPKPSGILVQGKDVKFAIVRL